MKVRQSPVLISLLSSLFGSLAASQKPGLLKGSGALCKASTMTGISPEVCCSQSQRGSPMPLIKLPTLKENPLRPCNSNAAADPGLTSRLSSASMKTQPPIVTAVIRELLGLYLEMHACLLLERKAGNLLLLLLYQLFYWHSLYLKL